MIAYSRILSWECAIRTAVKCLFESCKFRKTTTNHYMSVTQAKAIQIGMIANEQLYETLKIMKENIEEMRKYFWGDTGVEPIGREIIERIISKCIFTKEYGDEVSKNFQSLVPYFGQRLVGGDEKCFLFQGMPRYSKTTTRNTMGLWFYESCCLIYFISPLKPPYEKILCQSMDSIHNPPTHAIILTLVSVSSLGLTSAAH
jgi:hypothetical protein